MDPNYTKFSDTLTASFTNLYRVGGLVLVFIFIGVITMIFGNLSNSALSKWIFGVGAIITLCCLGLFLYGQLRGPVQAARLLRDNKETLDAVQGIALELTRAVSALQSLTFKHMKDVDRVLQTVVPMLSTIPFISGKLEALGISDAHNTSKIIVETSTRVETAVRDIEEALVNANSDKLRAYVNDLARLTKDLRGVLASSGVDR